MVGKDPFDHDVKGGETQEKTVSLALQHMRCKVANCDSRINNENDRRRGRTPKRVSAAFFGSKSNVVVKRNKKS